MTERFIILDTDPGIDDAVAIAVLLNAHKEQVRLLVTTYGNVPLEKSTRNALCLVALMGVDIPLVCGADKPGLGNAVYMDASFIHGSDGVGGLQDSDLFKNLTLQTPLEGDALQIIYDSIVEAGSVDYITLGPLTNLSALIKRFPDVVERLGLVVTMGGGVGMGNVNDFAEFNFFCDAESATHVLSTVKNLILTPINITTEVAFSLEQIAEIGAKRTPVAQALEAMLTFCYHQCVAYGGLGATMHDSTAVLAYLHPELFEFKTCGIEVVCEGECYGMSLVVEAGCNGENLVVEAGCNDENLVAEAGCNSENLVVEAGCNGENLVAQGHCDGKSLAGRGNVRLMVKADPARLVQIIMDSLHESGTD